MACCGDKRAVVARTAAAVPVTFEYVGRSTLRVVGAVTHKNYWFGQTGARVAVDARDAASVAGVPHVVRHAASR